MHSNSPKIISIRFDSHQKIDSNRFNSSGQHSTVEWWKVGGRDGQIDVLTLIFPVFVPAAVASTVQSQSNIAYRLQAVVESNGPIFGKPNRFESIRHVKIVNRIEPIQIANWNALLHSHAPYQPHCHLHIQLVFNTPNFNPNPIPINNHIPETNPNPNHIPNPLPIGDWNLANWNSPSWNSAK